MIGSFWILRCCVCVSSLAVDARAHLAKFPQGKATPFKLSLQNTNANLFLNHGMVAGSVNPELFGCWWMILAQTSVMIARAFSFWMRRSFGVQSHSTWMPSMGPLRVLLFSLAECVHSLSAQTGVSVSSFASRCTQCTCVKCQCPVWRSLWIEQEASSSGTLVRLLICVAKSLYNKLHYGNHIQASTHNPSRPIEPEFPQGHHRVCPRVFCDDKHLWHRQFRSKPQSQVRALRAGKPWGL